MPRLRMRRIFACVLSAVAIVGIAAASAFADSAQDAVPQSDPQISVEAQDSLANAAVYSVDTNDELANALSDIAASADESATIKLKGGETFRAPGENYRATFGAAGKQVVVTSEGDSQATLDFFFVGYLAGNCTFDNVHVKGSKLFCNGHRTSFTSASTFDFSNTIYAGANNADVDGTWLAIAGTGSINPGSTNGSHNIVGGCLAGSVHGDTYLEVSGNVDMRGGNKLTPASVLNDGTSLGTAADYVSVDGNAQLIYDNGGSGTPAIDGTSGCEIKGDLVIEARAGQCNGISAQREYVDKSVIDGDVRIVAGSQDYENTDRVLRVNSNWGIFGAGAKMSNFETSQYQVKGSVSVDAYENVWGWDRGTEPNRSDTPSICGAKHADVKGDVTVRVHGSHVGNVYGAYDTSVTGALDMWLSEVELRDSSYGTDDDQAGIFGLYTYAGSSSAGSLSIAVDGGDWALLFGTDSESAPADSTITVTGTPNIRLGVSGVQAGSLPDHGVMPTVIFDGAEANVPFVQEAESVNLANGSNVTLQDHDWIRGIDVAQGCTLTTTDDNHMYVYGEANVDGTWNQQYATAENDFDLWIQGDTTVGEQGMLASEGTATFAGDVANSGTMALMNSSHIGGNYQGNDAELRIPVVNKNYDGTDDGGDIPLLIDGTSTGSSTVYTVTADNCDTRAMPEVGQNYVLSAAQDADAPVQATFVLGNDDAICDGFYLKRVDDADPADHDSYHMWQIAKDNTDAIAATVAPMNLTVYTGGDGYKGVIGDDGKFVSNDFPEMGFYFALPDSINDLLGSTDENPVNLTDKVALTYNDLSTNTTRSWSLELYGDENQSHVMMNGRRVYIYKIMPSQIDGTSETVPFRVQFEDEDGNVMDNTDFVASVKDQLRQFKASVYSGSLDVSKLRITATVDGKTVVRPVKLGTSTLTIRANTDEKYADVLNGAPSVDPSDSNAVLADVAQPDTDFYINQSGVRVTDTSGVKLMVDSTLDDDALENYLDTKKNPDDRFSYEFRYMDLVDTNNGNAYLTLGEGQSVNVYWPVPADAAKDSEFYIVHFKGLNRDSNMSPDEMLERYTPEEPAAEKVTIDGKEFLKFQVSTFSPFALMYEKAATVSYEFVGDAPDGVQAPASDQVLLGKEYTAAAAPSAEGWKFDGWYTDEGCSSKFVDGTAIDGDTVLYGKWRKTTPAVPLKASVAYEFVGDSPDGVAAPEMDLVDLGAKYTAKTQAECEGWKFCGWCVDDSCATPFVDGTAIDSNTVLYGKWAKTTPATPLKACVSYVFVGQAPSGAQVPSYDMVELGSSYTAKAQAGLEGWSFSGWHTDKDCTQRFVDGSAVSGNMVLYGTWSKVPVTVSYEFVGQPPDGVTAPAGATLNYGDAYTAAAAPSADGWKFAGWFTDEACEAPFADGTAIKADTVLYGKWSKVVPATPLQASVAYKFVGDAPDGVAAPGMDMVDLGAKYIAKRQQGVDGYAFDGWYTDEGCASKFVDGTAIDANTVLYGKWRKTTPAIPLQACVSYVFVGQAPEGVSAPSYDMVDLGASYTAKAQAGIEGWQFDGWYADEDCTQRFVDSSTVSGNIVLYGMWSKIEKPQPGGSEVNPPSNGDSTEVVKPNPDAPQAPATPSGQETASNQPAQSGTSQFARTSDPLPIAGVGLTLLTLACVVALACATRKLRS